MRKLSLIAMILLSSSVFAAKKKSFQARPTPKRAAQNSGADSTEYIIKRTDKGILKIPKKQTFKFSGSEVGGQAQSPSQSVLGKRPPSHPANLIPERRSFQNEYFETSGFQER